MAIDKDFSGTVELQHETIKGFVDFETERQCCLPVDICNYWEDFRSEYCKRLLIAGRIQLLIIVVTLI